MPQADLIFVAISNETTRHLCEQALGAKSYRCLTIFDRDTLNSRLLDSTPAAILLEQEFDNTEGILIAEEILERFPGLPILIHVHHDPLETIKRSIAIGISDCLIQPIKKEDILKAVENSLKRAGRLGERYLEEFRGTKALRHPGLNELQNYTATLDYLEEGVILLDEHMNVLLINMPVRRAFGVGRDEEVLGKSLAEVLTHPDLQTQNLNKKGKSLKTSEVAFDDGRVLSLHQAALPGIGFIITLQDISSFKHIDRLKNEFVNTMSHDLRSPLTAILGYVHLLERVGPLTTQQRKFIERIQQSVHNITLLANDLMDLGRIEAGIDDQQESVNLTEIVRDALEMAKGQILQKHLVIGTTFPEASPILLGNPIRLRQLVDNLLGNAIKYTPASGKVHVAVEALAKQVILWVHDTGQGIPLADQAFIFEKFYRASNVPEGVGGSGIGLAIVKSIVENHHGRIWVESEEGKGSTFTVVLPVETQQELVEKLERSGKGME